MKKSFLLLFTLITPCIVTSASAAITGFITSQDLIKDTASNVSLQNAGNSATTVYGLYVAQYAMVNPGDSCNTPEVLYPATDNAAAGAVVEPISIAANQSAVLGSNYLYNLIYSAISYKAIHSSDGCSLPGCTWGNDSTIYHWCIYLGAIAPVTRSSEYTSTVPPSMNQVSSTGSYNYSLVTSYHYIGPISCNDETFTCTVDNSQTQSFS